MEFENKIIKLIYLLKFYFSSMRTKFTCQYTIVYNMQGRKFNMGMVAQVDGSWLFTGKNKVESEKKNPTNQEKKNPKMTGNFNHSIHPIIFYTGSTKTRNIDNISPCFDGIFSLVTDENFLYIYHFNLSFFYFLFYLYYFFLNELNIINILLIFIFIFILISQLLM